MAASGVVVRDDNTSNDYAAGIAAGVATVLVGHPFDTIKVKLQTQRQANNGGHSRSAFHCSARILRTEGDCSRGLSRGRNGLMSIEKAAIPYIVFNHGDMRNSYTIGLASARRLRNVGSLIEGSVQEEPVYTPGRILFSREFRKYVFYINQDYDEGIKGFYRGATPSFIGVSVESAVLFGSYSQLKTFFQAGDVNSPLLSAVVPAAVLAGASVGTILCPAELVKCRLQVDPKGSAVGAQQYDGPVDCIRKTVKMEGVQGLFRGLTATCLREAIGNACFFITYESTRHQMLRYAGLDPTRASSLARNPDFRSQAERSLPRSPLTDFLMETGVGIISGGLSGIAFWTVVLPIDVAKTRIQTARDLSTSRNALVHLRMIYRELGVRGLYAGLGPTLARAFPANAAAICAWEATARLLAAH